MLFEHADELVDALGASLGLFRVMDSEEYGVSVHANIVIRRKFHCIIRQYR